MGDVNGFINGIVGLPDDDSDIPEVCLVTGSEAVMRSLPRELMEECHYFRNKGFRSG